ncbi:MAG: iron complex transport system ATP-binding protein [Luteibaculaceae bacterium]|jgi:iron complex transport system ATP-binding protein
MEKVITLSDLNLGYNKRVVLKNINAELHQGELLGLLGENGKGKSTLLHTIVGLKKAFSGTIQIQGKNLSEFKSGELAKAISVVLSNKVSTNQFSVEELVSLGRIPFTNWSGALSAADLEKVKWAMDQVEISHLAEKRMEEISDGERQRTMIAKALAQDTPIILLDEPTAHLDLNNRVALLNLLRKLAKTTGKSILFSTHELELAIQLSDRLWIIDKNGTLHQGFPEDLALNGTFNTIFDSKNIQFDKNSGSFKVDTDYLSGIKIISPNPQLFWLENALRKIGFHQDSKANISIEFIENKGFSLQDRTGEQCFETVQTLITGLILKKPLQN